MTQPPAYRKSPAKSASKPKPGKKERLAKALRKNLLRRKSPTSAPEPR